MRDAFGTVCDMGGSTFPQTTDEATAFVVGRVLRREAGAGAARLRPATTSSVGS